MALTPRLSPSLSPRSSPQLSPRPQPHPDLRTPPSQTSRPHRRLHPGLTSPWPHQVLANVLVAVGSTQVLSCFSRHC